jgi:hypothetical protein
MSLNPLRNCHSDKFKAGAVFSVAAFAFIAFAIYLKVVASPYNPVAYIVV